MIRVCGVVLTLAFGALAGACLTVGEASAWEARLNGKGVAAIRTVRVTHNLTPGQVRVERNISCGRGIAIGGGFGEPAAQMPFQLSASYPRDAHTWHFTIGRIPGRSAGTIVFHVVCLDPA